MKVAIAHYPYPPYFQGGGETVVATLAQRLVSAGHEVTVVSLTPERRIKTEHVSGVKVVRIPHANIYWVLKDFRAKRFLKPLWHVVDLFNFVIADRVQRVLEAEKPDVVHTHGIAGMSPLLWRSAKALGLGIVHTTHCYNLICPRASMFRRGRNCSRICAECRGFALVKRAMSRHVDAAIGVSNFILHRHLSFGFFPNAFIRQAVHNGITPEKESISIPNHEELRPTLSFGFLSRLPTIKGAGLLLQEFARLDGMPAELLIGGSGESAYERRVRERSGEKVKLLGFVNPREFFKNVGVLIVPSLWHEPFGMVTLEAYSYGVPVIGSKRGGIPELIEDGKTGFLFEPDNPGELAQVMQRFVERPQLARELGANAREHAIENFSVERMVNDYVDVYTRTIEVMRQKV